MMEKGKIIRRILISLLILQAIVELVIGSALLVDFPASLQSGFGISYTPELDILGVALGLYLLLLTALMLISSVWVSRNNVSGLTLSIIIGSFLLLFGLVAFLKTGTTQGIFVDSIRGGLTIFFAIAARKELTSSKF